MLIVLDNCEHLADAVAALAEQLHLSAAELHLLVTSREALRVEGEQMHLLEPLEGPANLDAGASELLKFPAVQLFIERAAAGGYREPLDDATAPLVARICHRLDGIALAIELVASRVGTYGLQRTADLLDNKFKLLWQGRRSALPRHQTLHAMLDWSFNLLSENDRAMFARLGVFAGPFDLEAVQAVVGDADLREVEQPLDHLVEKSLVWTFESETASYYRLPHVARDFALAELSKRNERRDVSERHARYVLRMLSAANPGEPFDLMDAAPPLPPVLPPCLRVALNWSFSDQGDRKLAVELAVAAAPIWLRIGLLGECCQWTRRALRHLDDREQGGVAELALQEALASSVMFALGDSEIAGAALERGRALAEARDMPARQLRFLAGQHTFVLMGGEFGETVAIALRSLEMAERSQDQKARVAAEWMLGCSYHLVGRQKDAELHCDRGFAIAAGRDLHINFFGFDLHVRILIILARCHWIQGRWDRGLAYCSEAIAIAERRANPVGLYIALINTAIVLLWNRSFDEVETVIDRLEKHVDRHVLAYFEACSLFLRGALLDQRGEHELAVERIDVAIARLDERNHRVFYSCAQRALAEALMRAGQLRRALTVVDDAIGRAGRTGGEFDLSELLRTRGEICLRAGDAAEAESAFVRAVVLADEQGALSWRLRCGEALARLWLSQGRTKAAHEEVVALLARLAELGSRELLEPIRDRLLGLKRESSRRANLHNAVAAQ